MNVNRRQVLYTIEDYFNLPDNGTRYELVDGVLYAVSSPLESHQAIVAHVFNEIHTYLFGKPCKVYTSPLDVILGEKDVVQPDILVLCDRNKIINGRINGSPDMVIEVWSESTGGYDLVAKRRKYEKSGVREYWIIVDESLVYQYLPGKNGRYYETVHYSENGEDIEVPVTIFNGELKVRLGGFIHEW